MSALDWSITAMRETTGRLLRATDWDRANGFAVISEAVWWVTMVDATLMRYHPDIHGRVLAGQDPGQCRMTEDAFAGLRFVRNRMGYDTDPGDFIQPAVRQPSRRWPHRGLDLAASSRTRARIAHAGRAGSGIVVTGDITQIDLPAGQLSGLKVVREILTDIDDVSFSFLTSADVVRHRLVGEIVDAYEKWDAASGTAAPDRQDRSRLGSRQGEGRHSTGGHQRGTAR